MLRILTTTRSIRLACRGALLPWLGPALRGLSGGRLKAATCRHTVVDQLAKWTYCTGCPLMRGCAYGETFEPDPPAGLHTPMGQEQVARPIVFAPQFPLPEFADAGYTFELSIRFIGPTATSHAREVWESVRIGGADLGLGLGDDHIPFDVLPGRGPDVDAVVELPLRPNDKETIPTVTIQLNSPLFLTVAGDRREPLIRPSFGELLRAGLRTLGPLHKFYGRALPDDVFARVKQAAEAVPAQSCAMQEYAQPKWSHRTKQRFLLRGAVGELTCGPVPSWLMPWLEWSGKLHVGTHRIAGAGGWRVV